MKTKVIMLLVAILLPAANGFAQSARDLAERASDAIDFEAMEMVSTLKIYDNRNNARVRQVATATRKFGPTTKTLIKFLSPADVMGTSILIYDHENERDAMWIYMPALRSTRRIVSSERGNSFMGSEFTNADMSKPNMNDFTYRMLGSETIGNNNCWKIEARCRTEEIEDENGFSRKILYIDKTTNLTQKVEYYDFDDQLYKIMTIGDYRKQNNGNYFAFRMEMENIVSGRRSVLIIDKFQLGSNLNENQFAASALER